MESERHPRKCKAHKSDGNPCGRWAIEGGTVCPTHGGSTAQAKRKAAERKSEREVLKALGELPAENVDPAEALLWLCSAKFAEVHWLRSKVMEVQQGDTGDGDLTWGVTQHEEGVGPEGPIDKSTSKAEPNIWWRLLREAEDQLAKYSAAALKAGVQQRQLELQETQALVLAEAVRRILDQLELSQHQAQLVSTVVPQVLRSLPISQETK